MRTIIYKPLTERRLSPEGPIACETQMTDCQGDKETCIRSIKFAIYGLVSHHVWRDTGGIGPIGCYMLKVPAIGGDRWMDVAWSGVRYLREPYHFTLYDHEHPQGREADGAERGYLTNLFRAKGLDDTL